MVRDFISKYGYVKPNSIVDQSENGVQFTIELHFLREQLLSNYLAELLTINVDSNGGEFRTLPSDPNPRFSLDQMCAVAGFARRTNNLHLLTALPLFRAYSLRPDNFIYLLYCKYPWLGFWFLWVTSLSMIISCYRTKNRTSGKILAYIKARGASMWLTWSICEKVLPWSMVEIFQEYFPEECHPINKTAREVFK